MRLELSGVRKTYGRHAALESVTLSTGDVRSLVIVGPSGGGKSTLLRIIGGLECPDAGTVALDGRRVAFEEGFLREYRRTIGTVFQAYNLFPHLSALRNITLPLEKVHNLPPREAEQVAFDLLDRFRLSEHARKKPYELSGGQRQRVAIARAMSIKPRVLLFDEPTSALDPEMTAEVLEMIAEIKNEGRNIIIVTHEMGFARAAGDEAVFLAEGRVVEHGPANRVLGEPAEQLTREFLERVMRY